MENRPVKIDELTIEDHFFLTLGIDECYYFGSYFKEGLNNPDNSLIYNIKKKPSTIGSPGYQYKDIAINQIALIFRDAFSNDIIKDVTFVPIPPSKIKGHLDYDDRMTKILNLALNSKNADIRELIEQIESTNPVHSLEIRPTIQEIENNIKINDNLCENLKDTIFLVDDVITTGAHYIAIKNIIIKKFPTKKVVGVFICRRVIKY